MFRFMWGISPRESATHNVWRGLAFGEAPASQRRAYSALFQRLIALAADPLRMQNLYFFPARTASISAICFCTACTGVRRRCVSSSALSLIGVVRWRGFVSVALKKEFMHGALCSLESHQDRGFWRKGMDDKPLLSRDGKSLYLPRIKTNWPWFGFVMNENHLSGDLKTF